MSLPLPPPAARAGTGTVKTTRRLCGPAYTEKNLRVSASRRPTDYICFQLARNSRTPSTFTDTHTPAGQTFTKSADYFQSCTQQNNLASLVILSSLFSCSASVNWPTARSDSTLPRHKTFCSLSCRPSHSCFPCCSFTTVVMHAQRLSPRSRYSSTVPLHKTFYSGSLFCRFYS